MSWLNVSNAILSLVVFQHSLLHADEKVDKKHEVSSNLNTLLELILSGCSIQFIMHPNVSSHEKIVSLLQEKSKCTTCYKTFLVKTYGLAD